MAVTIKLKTKDKTEQYLRLPKKEAQELVSKGKARFADKNEWRRWQLRKKNEQQ